MQIGEMILDFVKDSSGTEWFIGVKGFRVRNGNEKMTMAESFGKGLLKDIKVVNYDNKDLDNVLIEGKKDQKFEDATIFSTCKLCKCMFRKEQLKR
jgi:hypothetical protein